MAANLEPSTDVRPTGSKLDVSATPVAADTVDASIAARAALKSAGA